MLELPLFGAIRHMKRIGQLDEHRALRARNEARLAALKASNRLYEDKREPTPVRNYPAGASAFASAAAFNAYIPGYALANIIGSDFFGIGDRFNL